MNQQATEAGPVPSRRKLRRTIAILVAIATTFYLMSFAQILFMK